MTAANTNGYTGTFELDFERPLLQLERQIAQLEAQAAQGGVDLSKELEEMRRQHQTMLEKTYQNLTPWQVVQVARHPGRPQGLDYVRAFVKEFCELHGDRHFGDDPAIITGFGRVGPHKCLVVVHHKGHEVKERLRHNYGMAHPEGYRKAIAKMKLAEKFGLPVVVLIDTPGAYPGIGAEERGQAEAIAVNLREMSRLEVPIVAAVISEGGSGGALGLGVADRVAMLQYAWYSVISPEGCASILWKKASPETNAKAAAALKLTAGDNLKLGVIDAVIEEPMGGAHRNIATTAERLERWLVQTVRELKRFKPANLVAKRYDRMRTMGQHAVTEAAP
jgi:acetyl-CoA carboxylase carboxyl transferase subunit alpha